MDAQSFKSRLMSGETLNLLDVREEIEFHTYNIGGKNIPLSKLIEKPGLIPYNKTDEIIVICKAGIRSETAQSFLIQNGYQNIKNLTGGLLALQKLQA
ncbi:rhodanese-like domain-containing protein [Mucilaginibacter sp. UR6-11]|uniref:rhodanese-like domain-containing protein n=1 Tax=Mucilaginibacter sp. UR6-11 TaxID=1435644 RepID=UPI001E3EABAE|nr:rhodanese-like domain-containing protein [Mucilaginibacter sp. UR6-11]MCC8426957.1 rhodanese-like domain-containing protein [Mucilaginibacter sp. UR6-11]